MSLPTRGMLGGGLSLATRGMLYQFGVGVWQPVVELFVELIRSITFDVER